VSVVVLLVPLVCEPGVVLGVMVLGAAVGVVPVVPVPFTPVVLVPLMQGVVVQPVVLFVVPGVLVVVDEVALPLGVVPIDEVPFEVFTPLVEVPGVVTVLGLVLGVAVFPVGTAVPVPTELAGEVVCVPFCPPNCGELVELLMLPVAPDCEVCPAPAGREAALPMLDVPFTAVPVEPAPVLPAAPAPAAAPPVWATPKAVQQSASVAVIRSFFIRTGLLFAQWSGDRELDVATFVSGIGMQGSLWNFQSTLAKL
jgi:hypothetical protein